jgi:pimeloyl-ACP methyl ester carboxylesterase
VTGESRLAKRPRLVLVHGSVVNAETTWKAQKPLAERFELVAPNRRGFPPGPEVDGVDFEEEAAWLDPFLEPEAGSVAGKAGDARPEVRDAFGHPRTHLVGHSYGGVIALFAAARRPEALRSLTVVEPPAFGIARGTAAAEAAIESGERLWREGPHEPEAFLRAFAAWVGARLPSGRLSPALLQGARLLRRERAPWEADPPLERLDGLPVLAVSGGHDPAFEAVCDALAERVGAARAVIPGGGHSVQRLGEPFNALLAAFVERTNRSAAALDGS